MTKIQPLGLGAGESAEEFLGAVLTAVPAFITRVDSRYVIRYINLVQRGLLPESVIGADVFSFVAPEYHDVARRCFEGVQQSLNPASYDSIAAGPDGTSATYTNYVAAIDDGEQGIGLCIVGVDVTEQRNQQAALANSEGKLNLAVNATGLGVWSWDIATDLVDWNDRMFEITGLSEPAGLDAYLAQVVHPEDRGMVAERGGRAMQTGVFEEGKHRIVRPDGTVRWVLAMGAVETGEQGKPVRLIGGTLDVTEQHLLQERLQQTERQQSLAHLTAGVAHNFNNMLMVMMPTLELLRDAVPPENQEDVTHALAAARRSADMVRQLMTIGGTENRSQPPSSTPLAEILANLVTMSRQILPKEISFVTEQEDNEVRVAIRAAELEQILLNLVLNARDAVTTTDQPRIEIRVHGARVVSEGGGGRVRIEVSDNGTGMSESVRRDIFEPFFTTKSSLGNGLGLSSAHALVTQSGGEIRCESSPGEGSRFRVDLPEAPAPQEAPAESASPRASKPCRILLVDDEDAVRRLVSRILVQQGFSVIQAASVSDAEALLEDLSTPPIQVVLLDRSMPGRSGVELLPSLRAHAPDAKVLLFSGDPGEVGEGIDGVVSKPVESDELVKHIAQVLGTPEG